MMLPYMRLQGEQTYITEEYVSSPPALVIIDDYGAVWALGLNMAAPTDAMKERYQTRWDAPNGEFAFDVLRNGQPTGEWASRIERRKGKVRIFCRGGWKQWTGQSFV